jgi:hypothetical protein
MTMIRNLLKPLICATLAVLVSYVTLGPIMQPATLRWNANLPLVAAVHADAADPGPHNG